MTYETETSFARWDSKGFPMHWFILDFAAGSHDTRASVVTFLMPSSYESYRWAVSREPRFLGQKGASVRLAQNGSDQFELKRTAPSSSVRLLTTDEFLRGPSGAPSYCGIGKGSRPDCSQCAQRYLFVTWVRSVTLANGSQIEFLALFHFCIRHSRLQDFGGGEPRCRRSRT